MGSKIKEGFSFQFSIYSQENHRFFNIWIFVANYSDRLNTEGILTLLK
jgi:hypothetical protein